MNSKGSKQITSLVSIALVISSAVIVIAVAYHYLYKYEVPEVEEAKQRQQYGGMSSQEESSTNVEDELHQDVIKYGKGRSHG